MAATATVSKNLESELSHFPLNLHLARGGVAFQSPGLVDDRSEPLFVLILSKSPFYWHVPTN